MYRRGSFIFHFGPTGQTDFLRNLKFSSFIPDLTIIVELKAAGSGWADVLVGVGAMRNLAKTWSGDGTGRGLRAATTDAHYANSPGIQIAKNMITNASFRAKKISEDIPKVVESAMDQHLKAKLMTNMKSISEETGVELPMLVANSTSNTGQQGASSSTTGLNSKTPTKLIVESAKLTKDKLISKDKLMVKLPSALGKVGIHKNKPDRTEKTSDSSTAVGGAVSNMDRIGTEGLNAGGNSEIDPQGSRPCRSSFERENSDSAGKKKEDDQVLGKEDRKRSVFEVGKSALIKIEKKSGECYKNNE